MLYAYNLFLLFFPGNSNLLNLSMCFGDNLTKFKISMNSKSKLSNSLSKDMLNANLEVG